ncbi:MAG: hypothetical protein IJB79_06145 [Candidatus Gastranaerophilales bacterium]|nr:hypothetical protein [Candidatus Gastranaerophilales bacterium]
MFIKITYNNKTYNINKEKLMFVLKKLKSNDIKEEEIGELLEKYSLLDEYFLENINKI